MAHSNPYWLHHLVEQQLIEPEVIRLIAQFEVPLRRIFSLYSRTHVPPKGPSIAHGPIPHTYMPEQSCVCPFLQTRKTCLTSRGSVRVSPRPSPFLCVWMRMWGLPPCRT